MDSYWDLYVAYVNKCERENYANGIDPNHYEMEWNHWLPKTCFPDLPLGQYLTLNQHAIASALQTLALNKNCMCGWHKKHLPEKLLELAWPLYGQKGELNSMFGRTGELNPMSGRTGELHPMFGKKRPDVSDKNRKRAGELHPLFGKPNSDETKRKKSEGQKGEKNSMFGKRGELNPNYGKKRPNQSEKMKGQKNPMYGKKRPDLSERLKLQTGELHPHYGTKWWVNAEGETYRGVESPGPEWQLGRKFKQTEVNK